MKNIPTVVPYKYVTNNKYGKKQRLNTVARIVNSVLYRKVFNIFINNISVPKIQTICLSFLSKYPPPPFLNTHIFHL